MENNNKLKIIFLDIDGVLNSQNYILKIKDLFDIPANQLDPEAVARLNYLTDKSEAAIVVSSSWRICFIRHPNGVDKAMADCLKSYGVTGKIIGTTTITDGDRADEIWDYIFNNKDIIDQFVILDDNRLEEKKDNSDPYLDLHLVKTNFMNGLQDEHVEKALEILSKSLLKKE